MPSIPRTKRCSKCGETKPLDEFYVNRASPDGKTARCKRCSLAAATQWNAANKSRHDAGAARYRARNREYYREYARQYRAKYGYRLDFQRRRWVARDPEKQRAYNRACAQRRRAASGECSAEKLRAKWDYYGGRCYLCGAKAVETDHVVPIARGGTGWPANLRPVCVSCNRRKSNKDWRAVLYA